MAVNLSFLFHDFNSKVEGTDPEIPITDKITVVGALRKLSEGLRMQAKASGELKSVVEGTLI